MTDHRCRRSAKADRYIGKLDKESHQSRTVLGCKLMSIRTKIVASGEPLLSWKEIELEIAERSGEAEYPKPDKQIFS